MKTALIVLIAIILLTPIILINDVTAGSKTFPTYDVQNTRIAPSFSYPDSIYWEDSISLPVSLSIIFDNPSISYVSVWKVRARLVDVIANTNPIDPDTLHSYAYADEIATDPMFDPLYEVENHQLGEFVSKIKFNITDFSWVSVLQQSVEAKIALEISLSLVGDDGSRYSLTTNLTPDQQPIITIQSSAGGHPSNNYTFPLSTVAISVVIIVVCLSVIFFIFRRRKK